ncbi:MAG: DUF1616 domain-containing protein [Candidatus Bathyarchaeia archaeon]
MKVTVRGLVNAVLVGCLVAAVGGTIYIAVTPHVGERFTEFYILGPSGKAYGYPTNLTLGESGLVIIGVVNHEYEDVSYRVVVSLGNETVGVVEDIALRHEESWQREFTFTPRTVGERMRLQFLLYREGLDEPYRDLHLWVTVRPREQA